MLNRLVYCLHKISFVLAVQLEGQTNNSSAWQLHNVWVMKAQVSESHAVFVDLLSSLVRLCTSVLTLLFSRANRLFAAMSGRTITNVYYDKCKLVRITDGLPHVKEASSIGCSVYAYR